MMEAVIDAMIPFEVEEPSSRVIFRTTSFEALREEIDLSGEARKMVDIQKKALKQRITKRYNFVVIPPRFEEGDLVF